MAINESSKKIKIWKASKTSNAGMMVSEKGAFLIGTKDNFVVADDAGVNISGNSISFSTLSENVRNAGMFSQMNDFVRMIPQTLVTPMPTQFPYPPLGLVNNVLRDLPYFLAMLV